MSENLVVSSSPWTDRDIELVFSDEDYQLVDDIDLSVLLTDLGIYRSRSQARQAGRVGPIPKGYTEFKASKKKTLYIWNPTE